MCNIISYLVAALIFISPFACAESECNDYELSDDSVLLRMRYFISVRDGLVENDLKRLMVYDCVLSSSRSVAMLEKMQKKGDIEAQMYAMIGLRERNRESFDRNLDKYVDSTDKVLVIDGCIIDTMLVSELIAGIKDGRYSWMVGASSESR